MRGNDYWLLGGNLVCHRYLFFSWCFKGNRLWKQHLPQRKTVPKTKKRKRTTPETDNETTAVTDRTSSRRKRSITENLSPPPEIAVTKPTLMSRYSSTLLTRRPVRDTRSRAAGLPPTRPRMVGTRASSRLRGKEEEWQEVPEEWLKESTAKASSASGEKENSDIHEEDAVDIQEDKEEEKNNVRFASKLIDDGSELTSLSDLSELPDEESDDKGDFESDHDNGDTGHEKCPLSYSTSNEESWETVRI